MKKTLIFLVCILSTIFALAQNGRIGLRGASSAEITKSEFTTLRAVFSYSSIESVEVSTERGAFSRITMEGTFASGEIGAPELPASHQLLAVPFGAIPQVSVVGYTSTDYHLSDYGINTLLPRQPSVRKDQTLDEVGFVYNESAYQSKSLSLAPEVTMEVQGTMRGIRIGSLVIHPVSYNPASNTLRVFNDIEVEIHFEGADRAETERMLMNTYSPYFDIVYKQMFNYRQIMNVYDDHPDLMAYPVHMIVVTPENYISTLQPWLDWKIQKGFDVNVVTTAQAGGNYNAIRSYVQNLYNTGVNQGATPTFLILVGDVAQVPNITGSSTQKVTDLYYGSVDGDYFPDMFYSRMSAENTSQLTNIINKVLQYEQYTMPDPSYLNNVTLIAGWDGYWTSYVGAPTINYATANYYNTAHGFTTVNSHINQSQYSGCYNALSTGIGFVNYTAHGNNQEWSQPNFTNSGVNQLTNTNKYFLAMGNCCLSGNFGYGQPCFGEAMIRAENKAAYSYIGSCPNTYWYEDYYFGVGATSTFGSTPNINNTATGVYDGIWMDDTYNTVSSMTFLGNLAVCYASTGGYQTSSNPTYYWQAYHVLGDGSIMPYRVNPTANNVSHATTFPSGASSFTVNAQAGSYVGISQNNELKGAALVPASGTVNVPVSSVGSGQVRIVVTKPQRQPYIQDITVSGGGIQSYTVSVSAQPSEGGTVEGGGVYNQGQSCQVSATPNTGYNFINWTENGNVISTNANYTFVVNNNRTLVANFELIPCYAPGNLNAVAVENSINLTWQASATATSYIVYRDDVAIANNVTSLVYTDSNLEYNHQYCYTVKANCANGQLSDPSNSSCATTENYDCEAPTDVTAGVFQFTGVVINWSAVPTAQSYKVYRNGEMIGMGYPFAGNFIDSELLDYGEYCYTVVAECEPGDSDPSEEACVTITIPCDSPSLSAEYLYDSPDDYGVRLTWSVEGNLLPAYFHLYRASQGEEYELIEDIQPEEPLLSFTYFDPLEIGTYSYMLTAEYVYNDQVCVSDPAYATVEVTDLEEIQPVVNIYPNPVSDKLSIESQEALSVVEVYNVTGALVYSQKYCTNKMEIQTGHLPAGTYFIRLTTDKAVVMRRFVKD